jgi:hypothetical protein
MEKKERLYPSSGGRLWEDGIVRKEREREDLVLKQYILSASESQADKLLSPVSMSSLAADNGTVMLSCWSAIARPWKQL